MRPADVLWTIRRNMGLPLLWKELQEQAARPRTYVIRFLYGGLLFTLGCAVFYGNLGDDAGSTDVLGRGRGLLNQLVTIQLWGLYLFVPAMVSSAITMEKERSTFDMLLTTKLRPWEIVVQKLIGRLVPVFTFLLLALPLLAIAYSFGGVTQGQLWGSIALLLLTCLQAGSLSIMCSAFFRSTPEAFVASYLLFAMVGVTCLPTGFGPAGASDLPEAVLLMTISIVVFLIMAVAFVTARAHVPPRNWMLEVFKYLDGVFNEANSITGGVVLVNDKETLPEDDPVAWRETAKKTLGTFRYLFRVLVVLELPVLFACQLLRTSPSGGNLGAVRGLLYTLWAIAPAMIGVHAASVLSSERSKQTLDVLLSTPMSAREIIRQKFRGVRRLIAVLLVPFLTIFLFETWWESTGAWWYLAWSLLAVAIYLPMAAWLALWIGLCVPSQTRAIMITMSLFVVWGALPWISQYLLANLFGVELTGLGRYLLLLSPASVVPAIETRDPAAWGLPDPAATFYVLNFLLYGSLLLAFCRLCLHKADEKLGRMPSPVAETGRTASTEAEQRIGGETIETGSATSIDAAVR